MGISNKNVKSIKKILQPDVDALNILKEDELLLKIIDEIGKNVIGNEDKDCHGLESIPGFFELL